MSAVGQFLHEAFPGLKGLIPDSSKEIPNSIALFARLEVKCLQFSLNDLQLIQLVRSLYQLQGGMEFHRRAGPKI